MFLDNEASHLPDFQSLEKVKEKFKTKSSVLADWSSSRHSCGSCLIQLAGVTLLGILMHIFGLVLSIISQNTSLVSATLKSSMKLKNVPFVKILFFLNSLMNMKMNSMMNPSSSVHLVIVLIRYALQDVYNSNAVDFLSLSPSKKLKSTSKRSTKIYQAQTPTCSSLYQIKIFDVSITATCVSFLIWDLHM